jgi:hypothetical protein
MSLPITLEDVNKQIAIYERAVKIYESNLSWKDKYDLIFSDEISQRVDFEWYDPDMDYEDDAHAFMVGFEEYRNGKLQELYNIFS